MSESKPARKLGINRSIIYRACMVAYDVVAVNLAYWFALLARFYINFEFQKGAEAFVPVLWRFAPIYTVACVVIFALFNLYNTLWRIAGIRDMNRIALASLATALFYAGVSMLTGNRMPLTVYFIGPVFQFMLIFASRIGIKLILMERNKHTAGKLRVMVVGTRSLGLAAKHQIDENGTMTTACMVDAGGENSGIADGIPVISGTEQIADAIGRYSISYVMIADALLSAEERRDIQKLCEEKKIQVQDMTGFLQNSSDSLSLLSLLQRVKGPVVLMLDGDRKRYASGDDAMLAVTGRYLVRSVSAEEGATVVELAANLLMPDQDEEWIREYRDETGRDVSFF